METDINKLIEIGKNLEKEYEDKIVRTLKDMKDCYSDQEEVNEILKHYNPLIYEVFIKKTPNIDYGLNIMKPGVIGKEYYMTKGHVHKKPSAESYLLLEGKGKIVIQNKEEAKVIDLIKNEEVIVPEGYAHRLVNVGDKPLKVLTIYEPDAGHDYSITVTKRVFKE
ncbi:MAG: cupin domain-containing protein [Candidatus Woesearchaeota archaeon]|nr:MAG: cupin domain-containing protein [Candidatus Woesearchaeota archaeon]